MKRLFTVVLVSLISVAGLQAQCVDFSVNAPFFDTGTTAGAGDDCNLGIVPGFGDFSGIVGGSEDIVYEVTVTTPGFYSIWTCGSAYDTYIFVTDACCGGNVLVDNDDADCPLLFRSKIENFFFPAGTYYVVVDGWSGAGGSSGSYVIDMFAGTPPPSFDCDPAYSSAPGAAFGSSPVTITDDIVISGMSGTITDLNVILDISHTWIGDVSATLEHLNTGTVVNLASSVGGGGCADEDMDVRLDDEAGAPISTCQNTSPLEGDFTPDGSLSDFDGESINGTWRLTITDIFPAFDDGVLNSWCLEPELLCQISSMPNLAIPDSNMTGVTDTISFSEMNTDVITDLDIVLDIDHTWVGDLVVDLTHVQTGTTVRLIETPGAPPTAASCPGDNVYAIMDDGAATPVETECDTPNVPAINGTFSPNQSLSAFNGETMAGDWVIRVADVGFADVGTLISWCFEPTTVPGIPFNDDCSNATALECGDVVLGTTVNATMDPAPFCSTAVDAPGVWYTVVGNGDMITASLCNPGTNYDNRINVYDGSCGFLNCIGGDDDACGFAKSAEFSWMSEPCVTYYILVQGFNGLTGDFELSVTCSSPPTNLVADAGSDAAFCYDGGANSTVLGGAPTGSGGYYLFPYSYSWSPTIGLDDPTSPNPTAGGVNLTPGTYVYTVTVTDTCGNVATDQVTVEVWENPVANAGADYGICESTPSSSIGGSPTATNGTPAYTYSWSPAAGLSSATASNPTFTHPGVGVYTFTVTVTDANGCMDSDEITVTVWDDPEADAGNDSTICQHESVELGGTPTATTGTPPYTIVWTPSTGLDNANAANPIATPLVTTTYSVLVVDANGCTADDTVRIKVYPETPVSFTGLLTEYCENDAASTLVGSPAGGTFIGAGISGNTFDPGVAGPGMYDIIYTYTDINGCVNADTQSTVVYDAPEADAGNDTTICNNQTLTLGGSPTAVNGTPPLTYSWMPVDYLSDPSAANPIFTPTAIPNYSYTVTVTDANGCTSSDVINIMTIPAPVADAGDDITKCEDCEAVRLGGSPTATAGNGNLDYSYSWAPSAGLNDTAVANPMASPAVTTTYTVTVTDNVNGCVDMDEVVVTVVPLPVVSFSGLAASYCVDDSPVTMVGSPAGGTFYGEGVSGAASSEPFKLCYDGAFRAIPDNTVPLNFILNGSDIQGDELGVNVALDSVRVVIDHEWIGDLTMTLESPGGTIVTLFDQPGVPSTLFGCNRENLAVTFVQGTGNDIENECNGYDPAIDGNHTAHAGDDLNNLNDGSDPNGIWGVVITDITAGNTGRLADITLYFTSDGAADNATFDPTTGVDTFTVYYAYTDANGCTNIDSQVTIVNELPTALAGADQTICANEDAVIGGSPAAVNGTAPYTYSWMPVAGLDNANAANPTFTPAAAGSYTYTLTVTDANGCTDQDEVTITVNPVPVADAGSDPTVCADGSTILGGSPTASGGTPGYTYSWSPSVGLSSTSAANPTFNAFAAGTYSYTVTVTDANGCQDMDTVDILVHPLPTVDAGNNERICANESVMIGGAPTASGNGPFTYSWSPAAGLDNPSSANPTFSPSAAGTYNITVTVTDANGCSDDDVVTITVDPLPVVDAGADRTFCYGTTTSLQLGGSPTASGSAAPYFYLWTPNTGLNFDLIANPTFTPPSAGTYTFTVTVRDNRGCENSDVVTIDVLPLPVVTINGLDENYCEYDDIAIISGSPAGGTFSPSPALVNLPFGSNPSSTSFAAVPVSIPDNNAGGVNVAQTVSVGGTSLGNDVTLDSISVAIDHTWVGDLTIELFNPSGNSVMLLDQPGGAGFCGGDDIDMTIVQGTGNSAENTCSNNPAIAGAFTAHDGFDLNSLNDGSNPNGSWELLVTDLGPADLGTITNVTLYFSGPSLAFDPQAVSVGTYPIIYTYTDANGCTNADTINVNVNPRPTANINGLEAEYCIEGAVDTIVGTPGGGIFTGPGAVGLGGDPNTTTATESFDATSIPAGWSSSNDCGSSSSNANWKFSGNPGYNMSGTSDHTGNGGSFAWVDGSSPNCKVTLTSPMVPAADAGVLTFFMKRSNHPSLTLHNLVSIDFYDGTSWINDIWTHQMATANEDWELFTLPLGAYGATGNVQFRISVDKVGQSSPFYDDVAIDDVALHTAALWGFDPAQAGAGTHTIYYTYTTPVGCTDIDSQTVTVYDVIVDAGLDSTICNNEAMALGGDPTATGGTSPYTYTWSPATNLDDPSAANPFFTPSGAGTYTYTVTAVDAIGCMDMDEIAITVDTVPVVSFTGLAAEYCVDSDCDTLIGFPEGGTFSGPGITTVAGSGGCTPVPGSLDIGPHQSVYNASQVRGYWFQAPVDFTITSLMVPTNVNAGDQHIQVMELTGPPSVFATINTPFTTLFYTDNAPFGTPVSVNIPVTAGSYIGILGATNNGTTTTMSNSYGVSTPFPYPTNIGGNPVDIQRLIYQSSFAVTGQATSPNIATTTGGNLGRIEMEYEICVGGGGGSGGGCVPGSLSNGFSGTTSCGAGNMFDLTAQADLNITGFDLHVASTAGTSESVEIFYIPNSTWSSNPTNPAAWTSAGTYTVTSNGPNTGTPLTLNTPVQMLSGQTYAWYAMFNARYASGTTPNSNADLVFTPGNGNCSPFDNCCIPRTFNGTINYEVCPPAAPPAAPCDYDVTISASGCMDEITWTFTDNLGTVVGSGGPYSTGCLGGTFTTTVTSSNPPNTFNVSTVGFFNDNDMNYTITSQGNTLASGFVPGGSTATETGLDGGCGAGGGGAGTGYPVPDLIYYRFDQAGSSTVPNEASSPVGTNPAPITSMTQGGTGQFGTALVSGGSGGVNSGWNTNLTGPWTMAFWIDFGANANTFQYFLGDAGASSFRAFANGAAGTNNIVLRGPVNDVVVSGVADGSPHVVHFVYDGVGSISAYKDGVLNNTVAQTFGSIGPGSGFSVGAYGASVMSSGTIMDEFRLYGRELDAAEIAATWNQPLPITGGAIVCNTSSFTAPGLPTPVPATGTSGTINVPVTVSGIPGNVGPTQVTDVQLIGVDLNIDHTFNADLDVFLTAPNGAQIELFTDVGGSLNGFDVTITDGAAAPINTATPASPITGSWQAEGGLLNSILGGSAVNGTWTLTITDDAGGDSGQLNDFTLVFEACTEEGGEDITFFCPDSAGPGLHTIYYTFTDGAGCTAIDSQQVLVRELPTVTASADTLICLGESVELSVTATNTSDPASITWMPAAGLSGTSGFTVTATPDTTTQYTVWAVDSFGCSNYDTVTVGIQNPPLVTIESEPGDSICYGDSLCLTATYGIDFPGGGAACPGGSIYADTINEIYTTTGPLLSYSFTPAPPPAPGATGTLFWEASADLDLASEFFDVFDENGINLGQISGTPQCAVLNGSFPITNAQLVSWTANGVVDFTAQGSPSVNVLGGCGNNVQFTLEYCAASTSGDVSYLWSTGDTTETICPNPTQSTQYWVQVIDDLGCIGTDTIDIDVNPEIIVDAGADIDLCQGSSAMLGGAPTAMGGTPPYSYSWSPAARLDSANVANPTTNTLLSISYTVTVTDARGCVSEDVIRVTSRDLPKANAGDDMTLCEGDDVVIGGMPAATGGTGPYMYDWMPTNGLNDPTMANPTASPAATTTYTLTVTDVYGCVDDSVMTLFVFPLPNPTITAAGPFCENDGSVFLSAATSNGVWAGAGIVDASTGEFDPGVAGPGTHSITYMATNVYGCEASDTIDIVVNPIPNVQITSPLSYCLNGSVVTLTANVAGGTWTGAGIINAATGDFDPTLAGLGPHQILYAFTDVNGCTGYDTATVVVGIGPDPAIDPAGPYCSSDAPVNLTAASAGGTWSGTGITDPAAGTFDPGVAGPGSHVITYTVSAANGCQASDQITIVVNGLANVTINPAGPFCQEGPKTLLSATVGGGYWSGPGITNPLIGEFTPAQAGSGLHTVTYTVTGNDGCISVDTEDIMVNATPDANILAVAPLCANDPSVNLTAVTPGGTWSGNGITNTTAGTFDPATAGAGNHIITYEVTDANGCSAESQQVVKVNELPVISGSANDVLCPGDLNGGIDISVEGGAPPYTYAWSSGQDIQDIDEIAAGNYTVTVTDAKGCSEEATFTVGTRGVAVAITQNVQNALTPVYNNGSIDITVTAGVGPFQYNWSNGETTEDISGLNPDTFTVIVTDAFGCEYEFDIIVEADFGIGIDDIDLSQNIELFPNPTQDVVNVRIDLGGASEDLTLTVYDVLGRKVYERNDRISHTYNHTIDMENWASGQYMVRFAIGDEIVTKKVVLTK